MVKWWHETAIDMKRRGLSGRQIAKNLGIGKSTVNDFFKSFSDTKSSRKSICIIADTQVKPNLDLTYLEVVGKYIAEKKPDVIVHIGDHWDMPSLSSYDRGTRGFEGRRVIDDIEAGHAGMRALVGQWKDIEGYNPRMIFTSGNHESRLDRAANSQSELTGLLGVAQLEIEQYGWEVHDYLKPVEVDGIFFCHYLANPMSGKPYSGSALNQLKTVGRSFVVGHKQVLDVAIRPTIDGKQQIGIINGACLTPDHKILTSDLRYIPLGDVKVGDEVVSVDECAAGNNHRRFKTGKVLAHKIEKDIVYKVTLSDGTEFKVTDDHKWLVKTGSKYLWKETNQLRKGTHITKALDTWETLNTYDAGWLSGIYDGEGTYSVHASGNSVCAQMAVYQKEGLVLNKMKQVMNDIGFLVNSSVATNRNCAEIKVQGGVKNIAKLLGMLRPVRLLNKFKPEHLGRLKTTDTENPTVVSIEKIGDMDVVRIHIDEATMVVDGFVHHNCYPHFENYKGHVGNNHFRGITFLHEVKDGFGLPMFVSLDYLFEKYAG